MSTAANQWPPVWLDADLKKRYLKGDCHFLAVALHNITGWPVKAIGNSMRMPCSHAFVKVPDGRALDINGLTSWRGILNRHGGHDWANVDDLTIFERWGFFERYDDTRWEAQVEQAKQLADKVAVDLLAFFADEL